MTLCLNIWLVATIVSTVVIVTIITAVVAGITRVTWIIQDIFKTADFRFNPLFKKKTIEEKVYLVIISLLVYYRLYRVAD